MTDEDTDSDPNVSSDVFFDMEEMSEDKLIEFSDFHERKIFSDFLKMHTCYEMIPASGKIVVLDISLAVKVAFRALIENRIKSAPLWDSIIGDYVGMITVTDFIDILRYFYNSRSQNSQAFVQDEYQIKTWRNILRKKKESKLISIHPDASIYDAAQVLLEHHLHRVPIIDEEENNTILHVVSHHRILVFVICNVLGEERECLLQRSVSELNIGTYNNVVTILKDTPLIVALNLLVERQISAVPLVDETGIIDGVFSKSDAAVLAQHNDIFAVLDGPVQQFISSNSVRTCKKSDSLGKVLIDTMLGCNVRRVVCVDSTNRVTGIISLSDVLRFFLDL